MKDVVVLLAMLVMVTFALVPRHYRREQLAVLSWVLVWADNVFSGHWTDWLGVTTMFMALGTILVTRRHIGRTDRAS